VAKYPSPAVMANLPKGLFAIFLTALAAFLNGFVTDFTMLPKP